MRQLDRFGAGAALALLFGEHADRIIINDADKGIYAMWWSILNKTDDFLKLLKDKRISMRQRDLQIAVYKNPRGHSKTELGFATFYLNRTNRSGIIVNGGPIGGRKQLGEWGIDARFNKEDLALKIERIASYKSRISVFNMDAVELLREVVAPHAAKQKTFVYLDPPYYNYGARLYLSYTQHDDHEELRDYLKEAPFPWVLTYDSAPEIRELYGKFRQVPFALSYKAAERRAGKELMIVKKGIALPKAWKEKLPARYITTQERPLAMPYELMRA